MSDGLISRRKLLDDFLIKGGVATVAAGVPYPGLFAQETAALAPTGEEVLGPFYKKGAPNVRVLRQPADPGLPLRVLGRVVDPNGEPLANATVELWHADFYGLYDLEGFRYRARLQPDRSGAYAIDTIMPGHYPDRPAQHIHYMVSAPGHRTLITQAYFSTDPFFEGDGRDDSGLVSDQDNIRPVTLYESAAGGLAEITFDLVLARA